VNETARCLIAASFMITTTIAAVPAAAANCDDGFKGPDGFRGMTWGTPFAAASNQMTAVPDQGPEIYRRTDDKLAFGDAPLKQLLYEFYHGAFSFAYYRASPNTHDQMVANFKAQFGPCYHKLQYEEAYLWQGSVGDVSLLCNAIECMGFIKSSAIDKQKEADRAAGAVRAKRDF
jgi:hypothetical protein